MVLLGFSSGFPLLLVLGTMNLWLKDSGVSYAMIGLFSLTKIPYSFKWIWSPIVDKFHLPVFSRLGRRRGWALFTQILLFFSLLGMASVNPAQSPWLLAFFALFTAFSSATQDIVLDAYRVESFDEKEQGAGVATFIMGYRFGTLFSGAIALLLAEKMSWNNVYFIMATTVFIGITTILCSKEAVDDKKSYIRSMNGTFRQKVQVFLQKAVADPFKDFITRPHWVLILLFIFAYKMSDAYIGPMAYPFYDDIGFSKTQIAAVSKLYGTIATIIGSIFGGIIVARYGILRALLICGILQGLSNLTFAGLAMTGNNIYVLMAVITIENISGGMAMTAFVAYLSSLCNVLYTATQYALLSSLMSFARDIVAASSGYLKEYVTWEWFFIITTFMSLPGLVILYYLSKRKYKSN